MVYTGLWLVLVVALVVVTRSLQVPPPVSVPMMARERRRGVAPCGPPNSSVRSSTSGVSRGGVRGRGAGFHFCARVIVAA